MEIDSISRDSPSPSHRSPSPSISNSISHRHSSSFPSSNLSSPFTISQPETLYSLKLLFHFLGICSNKYNRKYYQYSMFLILLGLITITLSSIVHSLYQWTYHDHKVQYQVIGVQIWMIYGTLSYGIITYFMYNDYNIFIFLQYLSQPEDHFYGKIRTKSIQYLTIQNLNKLTIQWLSSSCILTLLSIISSLITFGPYNLLSTFLPLLHHPIDNLIFLLLYISNFITPIPMIIVRISSYFLEKRIIGMILYLEEAATAADKGEHQHLPSSSIPYIMEWYDELYHYNQILTFYLSPFVTLTLLVAFPNTIFLLQGFLKKEGDYIERITLCIWFFIAVFMLLVITCSVAQLDSLNRRIEIALGRIVSRDLFASRETSSSFDLALAKRRALPFGVVFYATRSHVSYSAIYKISSIILSIFFFFVGYS